MSKKGKPSYPRAIRAQKMRAMGMDPEDIAEVMGVGKKTILYYTAPHTGARLDWNQERVTNLIDLWTNRYLSIPEIATTLHVTPNMVIGKIHRLKKAGTIPLKRPIRIPHSYRPGKNHPFKRKLHP